MEFAKDMREFRCVLRRLTAVPHISQKKCFGTFSDSFSPRGEALAKASTFYHQQNIVRCGTKASPLREKLSKIGSSEPIFD